MNRQQPPKAAPRYRVVFRNCVWTIFDRQAFTHYLPLDTEKAARRICDDLNAGRTPR